MKADKKNRIHVVYSTDPNYNYEYNNETEDETLPPEKQNLRVILDSKQRKGKTVTLVQGFVGREDDLKELAKLLKNKCGVGGSVKDGEIIFDHVNFSYAGEGGNLSLKDVDLHIRSGQTIGIIGGTGSGKSTTLYTALSELNTEDINIITVEDPVEANLDGVNQVQVNAKADMTFASALRSILRQDPDIIMIGEIRDEETAEIAVQASITGHLVVSTLHTNSAAGTITRMLNMGVEGYLLADSVIGVIAQRLVRRLCPNCKQPHKPTEYERKLLNLDDLDETMIFEAKGCPMCANTGYKGRIGVYEMMEINTEMKNAIAKDASTAEIKHLAVENGMETLAAGARRKVLEGITSVSELVGVSAED